jgi:nitroreductase
LNSSRGSSPEYENPETAILLKILDLGRWAPSGDNTQPWRFEILSGRHLVVHGSDTRGTVVYDREGFASQIAIGALLENIAIAASGFALKTEISYRPEGEEPDAHPLFDVRFSDASALAPDPLFPFLELRCVNRRRLGREPLTHKEKCDIERGLVSQNLASSRYQIFWLEKTSDKISMARIAQSSGKLRLTIPEAYPVHKSVIEWNARFSSDRIPDQALGLPISILPLMQWIMESWDRVLFFNRFLGGTLIPRFALDILPALFCSAHFVILAPDPPKVLMDYVDAGRALCRFWLGVSAQGLQFQPEMTPLIFRSYAVREAYFSREPGSMEKAREIGFDLERLVGRERIDHVVFLGRVGRGNHPRSRSLRLPLTSLLIRS